MNVPVNAIGNGALSISVVSSLLEELLCGLALNHGAEMRAIMTATMMWKSDWMRPK